MPVATASELLIGELADAVGVNAKTIRYYEEIGLLPPPDRTASGYRVYGTEDVARLRFIRRAQQLDLRLDEIGEILALRERGEAPCGYVRDVAEQRLADLDERIAEMKAARDDLAALLEFADDLADTPADFCALIEHHNPGDGRTANAHHA
ncbi:MAG: heavy metal-responsive transcriptional regulator [Nitriliruptorales bacterium]|nr:heavy metal-responsive transcriptional regulator [Nitriliruptorales bacterium]